MAKNEAGFDSEINQMTQQVKGLGYANVEKFDAQQIAQWRAAMRQVTRDYANKSNK